jgi:PIN domain nuclease of toxin-antitoxin system
VLNLDTYVFVRAVAGTLSERETDVLAGEAWSISAIVLWEIERLRKSRIIRYGLDDEIVTGMLAGTRVWPITPAVCVAMRQLDFESDPADELIAATSIVFNVPLLTRDRDMSASRVVPVALRY